MDGRARFASAFAAVVVACIPSPAAAEPPGALPPPPAPATIAKTATAPISYQKPRQFDYRLILTGYKDNYFIAGFTNAAEVKFQFSVKFDLWPNTTAHSVYFGYTQLSIWNLYRPSQPFVDSNYDPEIFYGYTTQYSAIRWAPGTVVPFIDAARVGVEHESNGRDGGASRGWNRVYAYVDGGAYFGTDHYGTLALKAWAPPFWVDSNNADIVKYRGYGEATLVYGYDPSSPRWWGGGRVGARYYHGASSVLSRQAVEAFVEWRPAYGVSWWRFTPFFYAQLFSGYGEYLLAYSQNDRAIRVGISLEDRVLWVDRRP